MIIPKKIDLLIAAGLWPRNTEEANQQHERSFIPAERVRLFAPEERSVFFYPPPFYTISQWLPEDYWWTTSDAAPDEISFGRSVCIGDFGLGSDSPILLDYQNSESHPRVLRLKWDDQNGNHWVEIAKDFPTFAKMLGLSTGE